MMKTKHILILLVAMMSFSLPSYAKQEDVLKLDWIDLIPEAERNQFDKQGMPAINHSGDVMMQSKLGSVRPELNGSTVKIPGFVIPLEGNENIVTEFLLVPYFGACIHVPPPPPNQIVHVKIKNGVPIESLYDAITVTGIIKVETWSGELAQTGYTMQAVGVAPFEL